MMEPGRGLPWFVLLLSMAPAFAAAQTRLDTSSEEAFVRTREAMSLELSERERTGLDEDIRAIMDDVLCPINNSAGPIVAALNERVDGLMRTFDGKTAADLRALAQRVADAEEAERAGMPELPLDSVAARPLRAATEQFMRTAPFDALTYEVFFPLWTKSRIAFARRIDPGAQAAHARKPAALMLSNLDWIRTFKVQRIEASATKAYVMVGKNADNPAVQLWMTYQLEDGQWKLHNDFLGYPWSSEGASRIRCAGVLAPN